MSAPNILQCLSELSNKADKIIESSEMTLGVQEWFKIVKARAMEIVNNDSISAESASVKIPALVAFLSGPRRKVSRVSSVFRINKKDHLHSKEEQSGPRTRSKGTSESSRGSSKSPDLNALNSTFVKSKICSNSQNKTENKAADENTPHIDESSIKKKGTEVKKTPFSAKNKRKSSNELSNQSKKACSKNVVHHGMQPSGKSLRSAVLEKFSATKNSSVNQASIKSSVGLANSSILKENRSLRKKEEKVSENLKNALAARKLKIEENKKKREEKMEQTQKERRLEKEKMEKLKCVKLEKNATGKISQPPKATPEIKKIRVALTYNEDKGPREIKNATIIKLKTGACPPTKKNLATVEKSDKHSSSTRTPRKSLKRKKNEETQLSVPKVTKDCSPNDLNKTHTVSKSNEKIYKGDKAVLKGVAAISKGGTDGGKTASSTKQAKTGPKNTKTSVLHPVEAGSNTPKQKLQSYEMTPARSSYVSYDISEIKSDSEDDEQEQQNSKQIPGWATGVRLRNALLQQFHTPINTEELFGNYFEAPDLPLIMGVQKKQYNRRTSSAVWNTSFT